MELILLIIYSVIVWLIFFKFKWLPWNITSQVIVVTIPVVALTILILFMNIVAPSADDVRAMNYVIPIVPRVTGQVTEVPIEPNRPIKKGDVLFKIDPVPFEAAEKAAEATLQGLKDQLNNAVAKKAALTPRIDLAKKRVEQFTALAATGAGKRADLEQAQSDLGNLESEFLAADATEQQSKAQIVKSEADLRNAKFDLEGTTHLAPANGRVANLALRPGVRATQFATMPVMSFVEEDDPWILAFFHQNELRYVEPGNEAEILYGDRIRVASSNARWTPSFGRRRKARCRSAATCQSPFRTPRRKRASRFACSWTAKTRAFSWPRVRAAMARSSPSTERSFISFARFSFASRPSWIGSFGSSTKS